MANRTEPLIHFLRSANNGRHAETPIILAEGTPYPAEWYGGPPYADQGKNDNLRTAYNNLVVSACAAHFETKTKCGTDLKRLNHARGCALFACPQAAGDQNLHYVVSADLFGSLGCVHFRLDVNFATVRSAMLFRKPLFCLRAEGHSSTRPSEEHTRQTWGSMLLPITTLVPFRPF